MIYKFIFLIFLYSNLLLPKSWVNPDINNNYSYVYAPGMNESETHLAKYCPKFTASTGEIVTCNNGIETIQDNVCACNFSEINLSSSEDNMLLLKRIGKATLALPVLMYLKNQTNNPYNTILNAVTLSALFGYVFYKQLNFKISYLRNKRFGINIKKGLNTTQNSVSHHYSNIFEINVGQDKDINIYKTKVEEHSSKQPLNNKLILYGVSRGSATVFNYYSLYDSANVAAVICEGIFDSVPNICNHVNLISRLKINLLKNVKITKFKTIGICPLTSLDNITKDKPMAIITSLIDTTVPFQCTLNLYKKLIEKGFTKTHILILKSSFHSMYPIGKEKEQYQNFIHAFYKNYNLPYIEEYANKGIELFNQSQPKLADRKE